MYHVSIRGWLFWKKYTVLEHEFTGDGGVMLKLHRDDSVLYIPKTKAVRIHANFDQHQKTMQEIEESRQRLRELDNRAKAEMAADKEERNSQLQELLKLREELKMEQAKRRKLELFSQPEPEQEPAQVPLSPQDQEARRRAQRRVDMLMGRMTDGGEAGSRGVLQGELQPEFDSRLAERAGAYQSGTTEDGY